MANKYLHIFSNLAEENDYIQNHYEEPFVALIPNTRLDYNIYGSKNYDFINLGLPSETLWATHNIGANLPEDTGNYYAWGESEEKNNYEWDNYFDNIFDSDHVINYGNNAKETLDLEDDAAHLLWSGGWHVPTKDQFTELLNECTWTWTTRNNINGYTVTGSNNNSIFLPITNVIWETEGQDEDGGYYWTNQLYRQVTLDEETAHILHIDSNRKNLGMVTRAAGCVIRPVINQRQNFIDSITLVSQPR